MTQENKLFVRSNVGRDILQCAAGFQADKVVVWEYVTNGFEYVDPGTKPIVKVFLDGARRRIVIQDNGRGMGWGGKDGLENFFVMHGENIDRKQGRRVRGQFGTGKSAAFGIGDVLRLTTVRTGRRSQVELTRQDIEAMSGTEPVPVRVLEREVQTAEPNGTKVEIERIHLKTFDVEGTRQFIERHLARLPQQVTVFVNKQECEYAEPVFALERKFRAAGTSQTALGDVELVVRVAKAPLDEQLRGIAITSHGNWHTTTLAGSEGRDYTQYIFGYLEVPALDDDKSEIRPFDMSRSMRLNPNNRLVQQIFAFVNRGVETVRQEILEQERIRRQTEEARRLRGEGQKIADILNQDFDAYRALLAKARAKARGGADVHDLALEGGEEDGELLEGGEIGAVQVADLGGAGGIWEPGGGGGIGPGDPPSDGPVLERANEDQATEQGRFIGGEGNRPRPRGGFSVAFENNGIDAHRAFYRKEARAIIINLDHPQIATARGIDPDENLSFRRLAYEVAFTEYAVALQRELIARSEYIDMDEPLMQVRETLNRLARSGASLYASE